MGRPRKKPEGSDAKTVLIKTFIKLCYWRGTGAVTLQELARECGVAFNTAHYHFGGPGYPLVETAWSWIEADRKKFIDEAVEASLKKSEKNPLKAFVKAQFAWCDHRKENASFWLFRLYRSSTHASKRAAGAGGLENEALALRRLCQEAVGAGAYPALQELPALSRKITVVVTGSLIERLTQTGISQEENFANCWDQIATTVASHRKR